jgi:cyanophycin synthetase
VLQNPRVEAAVLETARGGILRAGLGFDRCDVAVVTNIGQGDHLGIADIDTLEELSYVKSTLVAAVAPGGAAVLWADDPHVVSMAPYCRGSVIYFSRDGRHEVVVRHRAAGGRAVFDRGGHIHLAKGERETVLTSLRRVPLTHGGRIGFQVLNALAAAAAAWGLGLAPQTIRDGLESFAARMGMVPGRFNVLEGNGATLVLDYGHNTSALEALTEALAQLSHRHRSIVYSGSGDRRDIDLRRQGQILGDAFDRVILYEDPRYLRGLREGQMTAVFREGLGAGKRVQEVQEVRSWRKAAEQALAALRPGELLVIQPDIIDETVELIRQYLNGRPPGEAETGRALLRLVEVDLAPAPAAVEIREGRLGKAVHALEAFEKGQTVLCGWGRPTPSRVRESIQVDVDLHIVPPPPLLYLNHSCKPSCGILIQRDAERLEVRALRRIEPGEELTVDYATFEQEIAGYNGRCLCGAPSCRGRITGYKDLPEALRETYGPYIAPHLRAAEVAGRGAEQEPAECDEEVPVGGMLSSPIPLR